MHFILETSLWERGFWYPHFPGDIVALNDLGSWHILIHNEDFTEVGFKVYLKGWKYSSIGLLYIWINIVRSIIALSMDFIWKNNRIFFPLGCVLLGVKSISRVQTEIFATRHKRKVKTKWSSLSKPSDFLGFVYERIFHFHFKAGADVQ